MTLRDDLNRKISLTGVVMGVVGFAVYIVSYFVLRVPEAFPWHRHPLEAVGLALIFCGAFLFLLSRTKERADD